MEQLSAGLKQLKELGNRMIPSALKDLHERLDTLKKYIHAGGVPPPDRAATMLAQTGRKTVTYAEEARLIESGAAKKIVRAGKFQQNIAATSSGSHAHIDQIYKYQDGFPDLLRHKVSRGEYYPMIAAASGKIKNEIISGEDLFRSFGPAGITHGVEVSRSKPIGMFWGRGMPPASTEKWRGPCAVLDEWNGNGWIIKIHIPSNVKIPACTSTVSEQFGKNIAGQFLEGGAQQAVIESFMEHEIVSIAEKLYAKGGGQAKLSNGISIDVHASGWKGVSGEIGYRETVIPGAAVVERLGLAEHQVKTFQQAAQGEAKIERID
jgi:hypothetical protein